MYLYRAMYLIYSIAVTYKYMFVGELLYVPFRCINNACLIYSIFHYTQSLFMTGESVQDYLNRQNIGRSNFRKL